MQINKILLFAREEGADTPILGAYSWSCTPASLLADLWVPMECWALNPSGHARQVPYRACYRSGLDTEDS